MMIASSYGLDKFPGLCWPVKIKEPISELEHGPLIQLLTIRLKDNTGYLQLNMHHSPQCQSISFGRREDFILYTKIYY
jgi:hypothetical protein